MSNLWNEIQSEIQNEKQLEIKWQNSIRNDVVEEATRAVCGAIRRSLKEDCRIEDAYYEDGFLRNKKICRKHICSGFRICFSNEKHNKKFWYNVSKDYDHGNLWHIYNVTDRKK